MTREQSRRSFFQLVVSVVMAVPLMPSLIATAMAAGRRAFARPTQGHQGWPTADQWSALSARVGGRLIQPTSPVVACLSDGASAACKSALANIKNPFFLEDDPGATQTNGWVDAWEVKVSPYAVAAESAADVSAAVQFAAKHKLRLVVKGTGHDYFGRSNAADSLLVWTHRMRDVRAEDAFTPVGAPKGTPAVPVVNAAAGARWLEGYTEVTTRNGRYVQGGGCTSVGMAGGFIQGGGYGSFSRRYGTGAAGIVEAEMVLVDGHTVVCNAFQQPDLWWAIRGGGGGTFGIVTRITLATHEAPTQVGILEGTCKATSASSWRALVRRGVKFWGDTLMTEHWGEKIAF